MSVVEQILTTLMLKVAGMPVTTRSRRHPMFDLAQCCMVDDAQVVRPRRVPHRGGQPLTWRRVNVAGRSCRRGKGLARAGEQKLSVARVPQTLTGVLQHASRMDRRSASRYSRRHRRAVFPSRSFSHELHRFSIAPAAQQMLRRASQVFGSAHGSLQPPPAHQVDVRQRAREARMPVMRGS